MLSSVDNPCPSTRWASIRAASTYVVSFKVASACSGVLVRTALTVHTCREALSKNIVGPMMRRQKTYKLRRYKSGPWSCLYLMKPKVASSQTPGGWYGRTGGPPRRSTSKPLTASAWSRIIHDGRRNRAPRARRRLFGSRSRSAGVTLDDCR